MVHTSNSKENRISLFSNDLNQFTSLKLLQSSADYWEENSFKIFFRRKLIGSDRGNKIGTRNRIINIRHIHRPIHMYANLIDDGFFEGGMEDNLVEEWKRGREEESRSFRKTEAVNKS